LLARPQKGPSRAFEPKKEQPRAPALTSTKKPASKDTAADADLSELESGAELSDLDVDEDDDDEDAIEEEYAAKLAAAAFKQRQLAAAAAAAQQQGKKRKAALPADEDVSDEDEGDESPVEVDSDADDDDEDDNGPLDINDLISGALSGTTPADKKGKKADKGGKKSAKLVQRQHETPEARDARTIFLGNVPAECSTSRVRPSLTSLSWRSL